ncbi:MAG: ABC transporter permease [Bacteroidota bacterium]
MDNPISKPPSYYIKKKFKKNKPAVFGLWVIIISVVVSIFGYIILPDSSPNANEMNLQLNMLHPFTSVKVLMVRKNKIMPKKIVLLQMISGVEDAFNTIPINGFYFKDSAIIVDVYTGLNNGKKITKTFLLPEIIYPLGDSILMKREGDKLLFKDITGYQERATIKDLQFDIEHHYIMKKTFLFGTDEFGRDLLSRLFIGTRISLFVGLIAVIISLFLGITFGALSGFFRGKVDSAIMWLTNVVWSIPTLLLVIAINLALGKGLWQVFVAVGLTMWVDVARLVRGQIFVVREMEFVEAGRALGFQNGRIIIRHILPNIMGPIIVITASNFASAILLEAGLSFLGMGVQPPMPSWGGMIKEYYGYIIFGEGYLSMIPGCAIILLVLAFNFVGNGLRDALDTKME